MAVAAFELGGVSLKKMSNLQAGSEPAANRSPIQAYRQSRAGSMPILLTSILFKPTGNREQVSKKSQAVSEPASSASNLETCCYSQTSSKNTAGIFIFEVSIDALRISPSTRVLSSWTLSPSMPRAYNLKLSAFLFFSLNDSFAV